MHRGCVLTWRRSQAVKRGADREPRDPRDICQPSSESAANPLRKLEVNVLMAQGSVLGGVNSAAMAVVNQESVKTTPRSLSTVQLGTYRNRNSKERAGLGSHSLCWRHSQRGARGTRGKPGRVVGGTVGPSQSTSSDLLPSETKKNKPVVNRHSGFIRYSMLEPQ